jgi:hypothetical protein
MNSDKVSYVNFNIFSLAVSSGGRYCTIGFCEGLPGAGRDQAYLVRIPANVAMHSGTIVATHSGMIVAMYSGARLPPSFRSEATLVLIRQGHSKWFLC